jgi:putative ABC transport system substrate-binding protein
MRRRTVVLGAAAGAMLAASGARAQQPGRKYRVGMIISAGGLAGRSYVAAAHEQLAKHGFVEGRNIDVDVRIPSGFGPGPALAAAREVVAGKPDVVLSFGTALTEAAIKAADGIPVVFFWVADPLGPGFVKDLAKPGGNVTGVSNRYFELTVKRLELARELLPSAKRVAMVAVFFDPFVERTMQIAQRAAEHLGLDLLRIASGGQWGGVIESSQKAGAQAALMLVPFTPFGARLSLEEVIGRSIEGRFPVVFAEVEAVDAGGLLSYSNRFTNEVRRGVDMLVRVLRGEDPGALAVDQSARFELAVNLRTARAIGLMVPPSLMLRADRVIE